MTAPAGDTGQSSSSDRPRYRAGQVVSVDVADPTTGDRIHGHALVLKVNGDTVDLALLGAAHLSAHVDNVAPASVTDVHNPLPAPEAEAPAGS